METTWMIIHWQLLWNGCGTSCINRSFHLLRIHWQRLSPRPSGIFQSSKIIVGKDCYQGKNLRTGMGCKWKLREWSYIDSYYETAAGHWQRLSPRPSGIFQSSKIIVGTWISKARLTSEIVWYITSGAVLILWWDQDRFKPQDSCLWHGRNRFKRIRVWA